MGGRGGSGRSSAAIVQMPAIDSNALADRDIADAYETVLDITGARERSFQTHGPWVTLQRLRTALSTLGWDREKQDRELLRLVRERKAIVSPESNQKTMTPEFRRAALQMGGEDKHIFSLKK